MWVIKCSRFTTGVETDSARNFHNVIKLSEARRVEVWWGGGGGGLARVYSAWSVSGSTMLEETRRLLVCGGEGEAEEGREGREGGRGRIIDALMSVVFLVLLREDHVPGSWCHVPRP